ncbi:MAG: hypothetical protein KC613_22370, partial [Myxococcales bacterium]|nr:hypothetical protein [Myxococcales bacterium]
DADCGPGAYCSRGGRCFMACRQDADCPGGDTTVCADLQGLQVCLNAGHEAAGICAEGFVCGEQRAPPPAPIPDPEDPAEPATPDTPPGDGPPPIEDGDLVGVAGAQRPAGTVRVVAPAHLQGGCSATPAAPPAPLLLMALLGWPLRRRRR